MKLLIKNGTVIDPANGEHAVRDLWVDGGRIVPPAGTADQVLDAAGKVVCPGFVDIHMHEDPVGPDGRIEAYDETPCSPACCIWASPPRWGATAARTNTIPPTIWTSWIGTACR